MNRKREGFPARQLFREGTVHLAKRDQFLDHKKREKYYFIFGRGVADQYYRKEEENTTVSTS